ncbi:MAG: hypothetical protein N2321_10465 [Melioribacteraceae bacterium]|nr:hypothetical protein [Melioribacteraceae bacterium]
MLKNKLFIICFFVALNLLAQVNNDIYSLENRVNFANHLYKETDYLRAIDEYKIILQNVENDTIRFRFANSFLKLNRFDEASENFKTLFFTSLSNEAKLFYFKSNFLKNDFKLFRKLVENKVYLPEKFYNEVNKLNSISYFLDNEILPQQGILLNPFEDSLQTKLYLFYQLKKNPPSKNPIQAAIFSSLIPGAGKIYTGELSDGIISFIATTVSLYLSINNFQNNHQFRGWVFAGISSLFYAGNIYGSYISAKKFNDESKNKVQNEIESFFKQRNYFLPQIEF